MAETRYHQRLPEDEHGTGTKSTGALNDDPHIYQVKKTAFFQAMTDLENTYFSACLS